LRPLMQMQQLDANCLVLTITNSAVATNVAQVMASGNAWIEARTTAHPDGKFVGALTAIPATSSYQVQIQPGWNVIANQLSRGSNTIAEVLPAVPAGSEFYRWNVNSPGYTVSSFD